jgi:ATP-binding cassette, subfamily B, bacterial
MPSTPYTDLLQRRRPPPRPRPPRTDGQDQAGASRLSRFREGRYGLLLRYALPYKKGWAGIVLVTVVSTAIGLLGPLPLKVLVDNVLGNQPLPPAVSWLPGAEDKQVLILWLAAAELIVFALSSALDVVMTFLWIKVGQTMVYDLARDLFAKVQRRSLRDHAREPVGESIARVGGDSWAVHTVVDELVFTPVHALISIVGIVLVMAQFNVGLTALAFVIAPIMAVSSVLLGKPIRTASHRRREVEGSLHSHVQQTLSGISVVQAFGQEERQHARFEELARDGVRAYVRGTFAGGVNKLASGMVSAIGVAVVLLVGAKAVLAGSLSVGGMVVFAAYLTQLQTQFSGFTGIYTTLQGARASIDRVVSVLREPSEIDQSPTATPLPEVRGKVAIEHVSFGYEQGRPVLDDVSLEAKPGEVVAIVGATGAGKSTLVSLVPRFFDPDAGRVLIDGHDARELRLRDVRAAVSLVLQESFLFPFTIAENIAYGRPDAGPEEVEAAARAANAHPFIERLPEGYQTVVGERGATLSGGERQRVAIARALLKDAPILILDEPTSALDAETESLLLEALERLMANRTTLTIAHRLSTIRHADTIVVLQHGRVIEAGTHAELVAGGGVYARMHEIQFGAPDLVAV